MTKLIWSLGLPTLLLWAIAAWGQSTHDHRDYDTWYRSLTAKNGTSCCSLRDCEQTDYRVGKDGYEAVYKGQWLPVPSDKVLRVHNPTGRGVLCVLPMTKEVLCFVTAMEG